MKPKYSKKKSRGQQQMPGFSRMDMFCIGMNFTPLILVLLIK